MIRDDGMEFDERRSGIREQEVKEVLFDGSLVLETAAPSAHYDGGGRNEIRLHHHSSSELPYISCHGSCAFWFDLHVQNGGNKSVGNGGKTRVGNGGKEWREEEETLKIMAGRKDPIIFTVHSAAAAATLAAGGPLPLALVSMPMARKHCLFTTSRLVNDVQNLYLYWWDKQGRPRCVGSGVFWMMVWSGCCWISLRWRRRWNDMTLS